MLGNGLPVLGPPADEAVLDGYEIWASVGLLLLALVLFAVADRVRSDRAKSEK
ncbi:hypothetical protein ACLMNJ_37880 [Streptomyces seoulensis]